jgi:hypothetical protein
VSELFGLVAYVVLVVALVKLSHRIAARRRPAPRGSVLRSGVTSYFTFDTGWQVPS